MSVAALARRYKVSRAHVLRMLKMAEKEGSLRRNSDDSTGMLHEPLRETLLEYWAVTLMGMMACAHSALEILDNEAARAA
jgi:DNA-binding transcriptional regulator LsrR (DeoR family)